jgi:hypothetical protein
LKFGSWSKTQIMTLFETMLYLHTHILLPFKPDLVAFMSFRFFIQLVEGNPIPFALNYCFGHMAQLASSTFLCGPSRQFKVMFDEKRKDTTIVYLTCLALCLTTVFLPIPGMIKLFLLVGIMLTQCAASLWYSLSYIPYGRRTALRLVKKYLGIEESPVSSYNMVLHGNGMTSV